VQLGDGDFDLEAKRAELIAQTGDAPQINDQWRYAPDDPNVVGEPNFRILSAYRLPEAVLFQRTTDIRQFPRRDFPNGLEVCVALGSTFARDKLDSGRLTDGEWKVRLDSEARPDVPAWLRPVVCENGLTAPDFAPSQTR
jgi:hypothetical protein